MKRKTLTSLRRLMLVDRCEHHRILFLVGRMMSAIHRDGNSATPAKSPRFRCAKPSFRLRRNVCGSFKIAIRRAAFVGTSNENCSLDAAILNTVREAAAIYSAFLARSNLQLF